MPTFREDLKLGTKVPLIKTEDINDRAITKDKILNGCVTEEKLADEVVKTAKIADGAITAEKIAKGAVTENGITNGGVTTKNIADSAVATEKIKDAAIDNSKLAPSSVTYDKINDSAVITEKLNDRAVTTEKIEEKAITNPKLGDQAVDGRVLREANVETRHIANEAVTADKIKTGSITKDKLQDDTLTIDKFDPELRKTINAATGLPEDLVKVIQDVDVNISELQDTVFPITLTFSAYPNVSSMQTTVIYTVSSKGQPLVPDSLKISKSINDNAYAVLTTRPVSSSSLTTPIEGSRERFLFEVTKKGRTGKSTSATRYLCYYGGSTATEMTADAMNGLSKVSSTGVSFNPKVTTKTGEYIWLIVPSYLTISRVTSAGFDVTLAAAQTVTNTLGTFKAYRTANPLTAETWSLVIS